MSLLKLCLVYDHLHITCIIAIVTPTVIPTVQSVLSSYAFHTTPLPSTGSPRFPEVKALTLERGHKLSPFEESPEPGKKHKRKGLKGRLFSKSGECWQC